MARFGEWAGAAGSREGFLKTVEDASIRNGLTLDTVKAGVSGKTVRLQGCDHVCDA